MLSLVSLYIAVPPPALISSYDHSQHPHFHSPYMNIFVAYAFPLNTPELNKNFVPPNALSSMEITAKKYPNSLLAHSPSFPDLA